MESISTVDQAFLHLMSMYWNAANYLVIDQISFEENTLL
jgi:hypothetical protein